VFGWEKRYNVTQQLIR